MAFRETGVEGEKDSRGIEGEISWTDRGNGEAGEKGLEEWGKGFDREKSA